MFPEGEIDSAKREKSTSSPLNGPPRHRYRNQETLSATVIHLIVGGPGQITCNYHTIIPDTVACTIFNMLFVTFGGGLSAVHDQCTLSLTLPRKLKLSRGSRTMSLEPIQRLYTSISSRLRFLKMLHSSHARARISLFAFLP